MGFTVGDALGIGTEFMTRDEVSMYYPDGLRDYSQIFMDAHRSFFGQGGYTNDTVFLCIVMDALRENDGLVPEDVARRICLFYRSQTPYDFPPQLRMVLSQPDFLNSPEDVSKRIWEKAGSFMESNSVLGMSAVSGLFLHEADKETEKIERQCRMFEYGPRATGCSVLMADAVKMLREGHVITLDEARRIAAPYSADIVEYLELANTHEGIDKIKVDDPDTVWMVRKSISAALWALWNFDSFEEGLVATVALGGDGDTNAAIAGFLLGLRDGLDAIPARLIDGLKDHDELLAKYDSFADLIIKRLENE